MVATNSLKALKKKKKKKKKKKTNPQILPVKLTILMGVEVENQFAMDMQ
jgi:uncharacterized membrane protein YwzB